MLCMRYLGVSRGNGWHIGWCKKSVKKTSTTLTPWFSKCWHNCLKSLLPPAEEAFCRDPRLQIPVDTWPLLWIRARSDKSDHPSFLPSSKAADLWSLVPQLLVTLDSRHPQHVLESWSHFILFASEMESQGLRAAPETALLSDAGQSAGKAQFKQSRNFATRSWKCTPMASAPWASV